MSRESLRGGSMESRGGSFPGPPPLRPRPGFLDVGASSLPGPAPFPGPAPDLHTPVTPSLDMSSCGGGTNGAVPTLTTPTLTPTTLRNIEQMFGEADPHEPPPHHENAAGFVPPIISPTSGNSYVPLGLGDSMSQNSERRAVSPPPLMLGRSKDFSAMSPPLRGNGFSPPLHGNGGVFKARSPPPHGSGGGFSAMSPPPLMMGLGNGGGRHNVSPPPLMMGHDRHAMSPPMSLGNAKTHRMREEGQEKPSSLILGHEKPNFLNLGHEKPSSLMLGHEKPSSLKLGHEKPNFLNLGHEKPSTIVLEHEKPPSLMLGHDKPPSIMLGHDKPPPIMPPSLMLGHDKNFSDMTSISGTGKMREDLQSASPRLSRPHTLQLGQLGLNGSSSLPDESKADLINKFYLAAASFKTCLPGLTQVPSSASTSYVNSLMPRTSVKEEFPQSSEHEEEIDEEMESSPPPSLSYPSQNYTTSSEGGQGGQKKRQGGRKPATSTGIPPEEELKRVQRRERNKQAAARCRKRRLDQTCTLQVEVDGWEEKRRSLKEEIQQLETQKKGLEMVLGRHHGACKVKAKQGTNSKK